ncbi:hypothetical protein CBR_g37577 [Chara braunii]|uniref:Uncharacterized protein n=1 Tax=Chara braunii TaxID=69332 RepID=A0A388LN72_CHABU|nr:hypothetical protein CBR_g37577 [Chara braunii]|eukprot:GBG83777.1 hypothetical protein CBR_g37577 [Chara braunii]
MKRKVLEEEMRWEMEQTRQELEFEEDQLAPSSSARPPRKRVEQTRQDLEFEEDRLAPSSSARPPRKRSLVTPRTPSRSRRAKQPQSGIRIEEPSTPRTPVTRSRAKKNLIIDNESLIDGWRDITKKDTNTNVVDLCMSMRGYLRTRPMSELQCLCDEESITYVTREKDTKAPISAKMQEAMLRTNVRSDEEEEQEVKPGRNLDIDDN